MNPARSPQVTGCLPSRRQRSWAVDTTSAPVETVCTTSTSFITGAGLKKCRPTTSWGRRVAAAHSITGSEEVVVARIAPGRQISSRFSNSARLTDSSSTTASTTRSTVGEVLQRRGAADPGQGLGALLVRDLAALHALLQAAADGLARPPHPGCRSGRRTSRRTRPSRTPRRCRWPWCPSRPRRRCAPGGRCRRRRHRRGERVGDDAGVTRPRRTCRSPARSCGP